MANKMLTAPRDHQVHKLLQSFGEMLQVPLLLCGQHLVGDRPAAAAVPSGATLVQHGQGLVGFWAAMLKREVRKSKYRSRLPCMASSGGSPWLVLPPSQATNRLPLRRDLVLLGFARMEARASASSTVAAGRRRRRVVVLRTRVLAVSNRPCLRSSPPATYPAQTEPTPTPVCERISRMMNAKAQIIRCITVIPARIPWFHAPSAGLCS